MHHNLDLMHTEKHVFDYVVGTSLNMDRKIKGNLNTRKDSEKMLIRDVLHPITGDDENIILPHACHTMSTREKEISHKFYMT